MASSTLIGTAPDQVPTNGDLGDLAFQNKESIEFYDGRGGLSHLDITAISRQLSVSATDVFIYDTSKDSDGGAWRNRCQNLSWYNEDLNTATRGSRREFPSVAVIVATTNTVTIYDGDSPDLPMWMVFNVANNTWLKLYLNSAQCTCVGALNGKFVSGGGGNGYRLSVVDFIADSGYVSEPGYCYVHTNIARRNVDGVGAATGSIYIVNGYINDVAITVLPNAPIDAATGLPIPTIAVATVGGVSVINNNGTVENTDNADINTVGFIKGDRLAYGHRGGYEYGGRAINVSPIRNSTIYGFYGNSTIPSLGPDPADAGRIFGVKDNYIYGIGGPNGVGGFKRIAEDEVSRNNGMANYIASKYNTGWMPGDIKGAWLSDTTQETVVGTELVTNGTFDSNITGWSDLFGTNISWSSSGYLHINNPYGTATRTGCIQSFATVVGRTYTASAVLVNNSGFVRIGSGGAWSDQTALSYTGVISFTFVATSTSSDVRVDLYRTGYSVSADVDNISVRLADADRSVNNKGLQVFGNITKTPVAAGADLVAYSPDDYYLESRNSTIPSTLASDSCMTFWFKTSTLSDSAFFELHGDYGFTGLMYGSSFRIYSYYNPGSGQNSNNFSFVPQLDTWYHLAIVRRNNIYSYYLNGVLVSINNPSFIGFSSNGVFRIGYSNYFGFGNQKRNQYALWRISATTPSTEQIAKMYNDEKVLFQDNAKATLYGTSDAVTALAYDEDTNLLHVGTSSGRSVFNGLRRVDNTTDAVGACISAAGGLVVED